MNHSSLQGGSVAPSVIPRSEHNVSRRQINKAALKVLYRLHEAGYQAYLVGGGVRDLLLGIQPKDFDVATDAHPEDVKSLFSNCRLIGRRFRLAHIHFGREIIEVATFRGSHLDGAEGSAENEGRILRDNVFGTIEQDAIRRDFTINSLYYNIADFSVVDYANGLSDLEQGVIRIIGDPEVRYREDAVRMLRAARFSAKLGFELHPDTLHPIAAIRDALRDIPPARLFEEVLKLFQTGHAQASFDALVKLDLLEYLFPTADKALKAGSEQFARLVEQALKNTDYRYENDLPITPAFIYAVFLWPDVERIAARYIKAGEPPVAAYYLAGNDVLPQQLRATALPKRFSIPMREIWSLQPRLLSQTGKRAAKLLSHPRFRAAYDFLCLREQAGEDLNGKGQWWTEFQASAQEMPETAEPTRRRKRRRRRRGGSSSQGANPA